MGIWVDPNCSALDARCSWESLRKLGLEDTEFVKMRVPGILWVDRDDTGII